MDDAALVDRLETYLMSHGIYLERSAHERETLHIEYETAVDGIPDPQLGRVCSELIDAHEAGWEPTDVHAWVFSLDGAFVGEWEVRGGWLRALENGNVSETDFSTLVRSTRELEESTR